MVGVWVPNSKVSVVLHDSWTGGSTWILTRSEDLLHPHSGRKRIVFIYCPLTSMHCSVHACTHTSLPPATHNWNKKFKCDCGIHLWPFLFFAPWLREKHIFARRVLLIPFHEPRRESISPTWIKPHKTVHNINLLCFVVLLGGYLLRQ